MRILFAIYFWTLLVIATAVFFSAIALVKLGAFITRAKRPDLPIHMISCAWGWFLLKAVPVWKLTITGRENIDAKKRYVIIANHESMADIWAVFCLFTQFRWLAKASLFKLPCIGQAMSWAGYVPVHRGDRNSHTAAMRAASQWLQRGVSMFFFPEGTRTATGEIGPFKMGAFKLAAAEKVEILPLVIKGARDLLPKGSMLPGVTHVRIAILPSMRAGSEESIDHFAERVRQIIIERAKVI